MNRVTLEFGAETWCPISSVHAPTASTWVVRASAAVLTFIDESAAWKSWPYTVKKSVRESETVRQPISWQFFFLTFLKRIYLPSNFKTYTPLYNNNLQMVVCRFRFFSIYIKIVVVQRCIRFEIWREINPFQNNWKEKNLLVKWLPDSFRFSDGFFYSAWRSCYLTFSFRG